MRGAERTPFSLRSRPGLHGEPAKAGFRPRARWSRAGHAGFPRDDEQGTGFSMKRFPIIAATLLALAGCATVSVEARVRKSLIEAGLSPPMAQCMAERMADRLSIAQLRRLRDLAHVPGRDVRGMSIDELAHQVRALNDPEIFAVVSRAGIHCALRA
jgi:hypothetical protein